MKTKNKLLVLFLFVIYIYISNINSIPNNIILYKDENLKIKTIYGVKTVQTSSTLNEKENKTTINYDVNLFGKIKVKEISVDILNEVKVVPVGKLVGLKLYTNGVLIVGMTEIENDNKEEIKPYENLDIKEGDIIYAINGKEIDSIKELREIINESGGEEIKLDTTRDGNILTTQIKPVKSNNEYKLGLWVKDAATGVGTVTFYEKNSNKFAALGHGIVDNDTGSLIEIENGKLVTTEIISIKKGEKENPGEIKGTVVNQQEIGNVEKNTVFGIYGDITYLNRLNISKKDEYKVASREEIKEGKATILCTIENNKIEEYEIEIKKKYINNNENNKSMLIEIIDKELIEKTGGIIKGISGAPIIQNGKFVGAVTHVFVSDAKMGYGVFGDLMIKELLE